MEERYNDDVNLAFTFADKDFMDFLPESDEAQFTTRWSDFNFHDPGVTTYEAMQLSFEDFFYRYDFPIQDLMQGPRKSAFSDWGINDLRSTYAVTEDDYRRVLATSRYIENIAVKPVLKANLNSNTEDLICLLDVNVATSLMILRDITFIGWEKALIQNRAVGEYFNRQKGEETFIRNKKRKVNIRTKVELHPIGEEVKYNRLIYNALKEYLLPNLESIDARLISERGSDLSKLFTGPAPNDKDHNNAIKESLFHQVAYRRYIIVSELFEVLERLSFVRKVSFVEIELDGGKYESSILDLGEETFTELNLLFLDKKKVEPGPYLVSLNIPGKNTEAQKVIDDLVIRGQYRGLENSMSLQTSFPPNYEMGKYLADQTDEEIAQTSSFRAFLYIMDQVRANISGQMGKFHRIFSVTKKPPKFVEADIRDEAIYKGITIPDLGSVLTHDDNNPTGNVTRHAYTADAEEIQNRFGEERLNYLLALNGWGVGANSSTFWNRKEYTKIKNDFLNLVHEYSEETAPIDTELNYCFQSNSLVILQEKLRVILQYDIEHVRVLEHLFLQPVWTSERGLNFELTVFLFQRQHTKHLSNENADYKNYVERMIRAMIPAHVVEMVKWIPFDGQNPSKTVGFFDAALKGAIPKEKVFYLDDEITSEQRNAMLWLKDKWVQQ